MKTIEEQIREIARRLLGEGRVEMVIGYEKGSLPLRSTPVFIRDPEEVGRLVWDPFCENNLTNYLLRYRDRLDAGKRIAVVGKGCDVRSMVNHLAEKQIKRDQVVIIGVPCAGMVDHRKVAEEVAPGVIRETEVEGDEVIVRGRDFEKRFKRQDNLYGCCEACLIRKPVIYDELVEGDVPEVDPETAFKKIEEFEALSPEERWAYFVKETSKCIRCYACRNACPGCYCVECFVDSNQPQWIGTTLEPSDLQMYHIIRALHTAGRCVACGACSRACPMGIDLQFLIGKIVKDAKELFGHEAGVGEDVKPALTVGDIKDPNEGFM